MVQRHFSRLRLNRAPYISGTLVNVTHGIKVGSIPRARIISLTNTSAPLITSLQPHRTGVFHVGWNHSDTRIASCSGDQSTRISCPETGTILHSLRGHTGTVKTATWNPHHPDLLSTGGRDGSICTWDLRIRDASMDIDGQVPVLAPVATLPGVHEISLKLPKGRPKKGQPETKSVTGLLYDDREAHRLISSGCADGYIILFSTSITD